jgi:hypothetical protein
VTLLESIPSQLELEVVLGMEGHFLEEAAQVFWS